MITFSVEILKLSFQHELIEKINIYYISSFFRRTTAGCWDIIQSNHRFFDVVAALGDSWEVSEQLLENIEEYVCYIYGKKTKKVNDVRNFLFQDKLRKGGKVIDLSLLPPCQRVLYLHVQRENMIARIWKTCKIPTSAQLNPLDHGWDNDYHKKWSDVVFPNDVTDLIMNVDLEEYIVDDDQDSDDEEAICSFD